MRSALCVVRSAWCEVRSVLCIVLCAAGVASAQEPAPGGAVPVPSAKVTFKDAVDRALRANPSVLQAAGEILRAHGLLTQANAAALPVLGASAVTTTINQGQSFNGVTTTPRNQITTALGLSVPVIAPVLWAQRAQARDTLHIAEFGEADVRRQISLTTAQAYLAIIARRRVLEADIRARETARAHFDLAHQQRVAGSGSLLNEVRAQQALTADQALVEQASLELYRAQEALGVLIASDGAVDTADEPTLELPEGLQAAQAGMPDLRADLRLAGARTAAAERVWRDSWRDWLPSAVGLFQPQYVQPATIFQQNASWRAQVQFSVPLFDSGTRRALRTERKALFDESSAQRAGVLRQAQSEVRTSDEAVKSAQRALTTARTSADEARQVVQIVDVAFGAGAATNIEVIDAQRALLDAETSVAVAEDQLRQAKLSLLVALGIFPS